MSRSLFDRQINQKLYTFESEVPAHLWDSIAPHIPQKKRRFGFIIWFMGAAIIGLGLWIFIKSPNLKEQPTPITSKNNALEIKLAGQPTRNQIESLPIVDSSVLSKSPQSAFAQPNPSSEPELASAATHQVEKVKQTMVSQRAVKMPLMESSFASESQKVSKSIFSQPSNLKQRPSPKMDALPLKSGLLLDVPERLVDPKIVACPPFSGQSISLEPFLEINGFGGLPSKILESKSEEYQNYKDLREGTESVKSSFTLQALLGVQIGKNVELKSGIGYSAFYDLFDYVDENASRTVTNIITDTIYDNQGNFIIRTDTSVVTEYGRHIKKTHNRYTFIDIPIMAGYVINLKNHAFVIEAGATFNLWLKSRGNILSPTEDIINLGQSTEPASTIFKNRSGWKFEGALGYQLSLSESSALRIKAGISYPLTDMTHPDYPLSQKFSQWRLGLSWKYRL